MEEYRCPPRTGLYGRLYPEVITVDVFVDQHGNFDPEQVEALKFIGREVAK